MYYRGMKSITTNFLLLCSAFFSAFFISEIILRIFWNPPYLDPKYQRNDLKWISENVSLNKFGYRDREYNLKKNDSVFRIYCLGDSYTYGWYINNVEDSWPKQLEKQLKEKYPDQKIEVINAAKPGFNLGMEINRFKAEGILFNPDLVLIGINSQDLAINEYPPRFTKNQFIRDLRLYQLTFGNIERAKVGKKTYNEIKSTYTEESKQLKQAENNLNTLLKLTKNSSAKVGLVVFPEYNPTNPNGEYQFTEFHQQIKNLTNKLQILNIDLMESFADIEDKNRLVLNPIDPHPSALADEIAAAEVINVLDFDNVFKKMRVNIPVNRMTISKGLEIPNFQGITAIEPIGWVYFNEEFGLNDQKLFLPNSTDKQIIYLEDVLKTVKSFTHNGWPGAKIDYNISGKSKSLRIPNKLYNYSIVGISHVSAFWRIKGNLQNIDLELSQLNIRKDNDFIYIDVLYPEEVDYYKVTIDVAVNQFDIDKNKISNLFSTKLLTKTISSPEEQISFTNIGKIGSYPQFSGSGGSVGYIWLNNKLTSAKILKQSNNLIVDINLNDQDTNIIEVPVALDQILDNMPTIEYLTIN